MPSRRELIEKLIHKYERYVAPFTFITGFLLDALTLRRIDLWFDHIILLIYISVAGVSIILLNAYEAGRIRLRHFENLIPFLPVFMQFGFGGLFSAFIIFYTKSGSIPSSWLFLIALAAILVGNERFRKHYQRLVFQLSIFFVALFSYAIFLVPLVLHKISVLTFFISGAVSLLFIGLFILLLSFSLSKQIRESRWVIAKSIGVIFLAFNFLYFTNIIPPIPLSIKEMGIYHSIFPSGSGGYILQYEKGPWYLPFINTGKIYHATPGERVFAFSAVFAPTRISLPIYHNWFRYDEKLNKWIELGSFRFSVTGGRDGGYRGYSYRTDTEPGRWRVDVATERGQIIGSQYFTVVEASAAPTLEIKER